MLRSFIFAVVLAVAAASAGTASAAHWRTYGGDTGFNRSVGPGSLTAGHTRAGERLGSPRVGSGYAGSRYGGLSHPEPGWYSRGIGGNSNPGWDYGFGAHLGGIGR